MRINQDHSASESAWEKSSLASGLSKLNDDSDPQAPIASLFASLPKPKNQFKLSKEQLEEMKRELEMEEAAASAQDVAMRDEEEDIEVRERRLKLEREKELE
mmetsp:Transcript_70/g.55  ORF Transcript_70/g.55 Transcript_70/m.55 type:complete len:102 (+) Transcript_70:1265-1570(+)|eukprot:CAMPEP_0202965078 /NCGR_PEP_ID=MMETSP1396-20130829/9178_1 /ASSEMBLY_ACC=CAM_ASM_000872 /TAXON_ID= /ORGANISM="Pseudokeronopsis sp., Strain Brazil" /LENGTH=101 /DNA_ID=CAMNT_0049687687 /DNA_START=1265 /DNA_END=1570 /DNA_ORIENTATION=-